MTSSSAAFGRWAFGIGQLRRDRRGRTGIVKGRSVLLPLGAAILCGALLHYIDRAPASADEVASQPSAPAQKQQQFEGQAAQTTLVSKLTGCIAFKARLNEGLKIFGDVLPPLKWRLERSQIEGQEAYEIENFPEVETGLSCDENGFSRMGTGLYEEGHLPQTKWNSHAKAILFALDSQQTPDSIQSAFIQLEKQAISDGQTPTCSSDPRPSGSAEITIGAYKIEYTKALGKAVQRAHLSVRPIFDGYFSYRPPIETQPRLSCQPVKDILSRGLKTITKTVSLAHLKAEHFQTYSGVETAILCDARGNFLGLTTGRGKRDDPRWHEWLGTVARAVKAPPGIFAKAQSKSDDEYARDELCRPQDVRSGFGSEELPGSGYDVSYSRWDDGEEVSIDP